MRIARSKRLGIVWSIDSQFYSLVIAGLYIRDGVHWTRSWVGIGWRRLASFRWGGAIRIAPRTGLTTLSPAKSSSLSVTTTHSFAHAHKATYRFLN